MIQSAQGDNGNLIPGAVSPTMDKVYDPKDPDTERREHDYFGDVWTVKPS